MTTNYTFRFIDAEAQYTETVTAPCDEDTSICDFVEEQVYIQWELCPTERHWRREFYSQGWTKFSYGLYELFCVSYDWDNSKVITIEKIQA